MTHDDDDEPDLSDEVPGGRHSTPERDRGKGSWLAQYGLTPADLAGRIVSVASYKGGVGKTFLAYEVAYLLGAILLDLDWDDGNATVAWGYNEEERMRSPLLDALEAGRTPRPLAGGPWRPDLVPCSSLFSDSQPSAKEMAKAVGGWAAHWGRELGRPVVVDTHPGGVPSTLGAVAASHLILMPTVLGEREMAAAKKMLRELKSYPLLVVPNRIPLSPPERYITQLERAAGEAQVPIGPEIGEYRWLTTRARRMAVTATTPVPKKARTLVDELHKVGETVVSYVRAA
ncbi:chromosome partitioning protein [Krasilnikovia cinnamomea]|uniref:Chromosome partitioning protein n=1 Tax=Krasilnikovia cinnamomea TaxID=349313 RepID=A0A4Q7Z9E5_9ACTN|nr:ParA family protein [Krasilnikovia cinnamomea]RZU46684.1 chromosome partitioning protein [Krasilnikovia cinnamomea]